MLTKKEVYRQIFHVLLGILIVILYYFDFITPLIVFLILIFGGILSLLSKRLKLPIVNFFLNKLERKEDIEKFPGKGLIFFFMGALLSMKLFPKDIALASIIILALGDSTSHIFGAKYGHTRNIFNLKSPKLLEGTIAGMIVAFLGACFFVPFYEALIASIGAMAFEAIDVYFNEKQLNDNLIVPLVAGTIILILRAIL